MRGGRLGLGCLRDGLRLGSLRLGPRRLVPGLVQFVVLLALNGEDASVFGGLRGLARECDNHGHAGFMVQRLLGLAEQILGFAQSIGRVPAGIRGLGDLNRILRLIKFHYRLILTRRQSGSVRCGGRHTLLHVISVVAARQQLILRLDGFSAADGIGPGLVLQHHDCRSADARPNRARP